MKKKVIFPIVLCTIIIFGIFSICTGSRKIKIEVDPVTYTVLSEDSIELKVYVENSGSMDAYMCDSSQLKDAVFDYISDLKRLTNSCSLNYINSKIIPYNGDLRSFIKDLTPTAFAKAGGDRRNTDLMQIIDTIINEHNTKTVSVFVSDCILDIPQNAINFLGTCQVSIKNTFIDALKKNPNLGIEIIKLDSKFEGYWYCGHNREYLNNKCPYYIWIIGDQRLLADYNKKVPVDSIIGGIKEYCAYATPLPIPFDVEKKTYVVNHTGKIKVNLLVNLRESLQEKKLLKNTAQFKSANPNQVTIISINEITDESSMYSHVIELEIDNPATLKSETITFSYPLLAPWISLSDDTTGENVKENLDKTTGLMSLIKGVSEAYKNSTNYGSVSFKLKNK